MTQPKPKSILPLRLTKHIAFPSGSWAGLGRDCRRFAVTAAIALTAGWLFSLTPIPAPYMMGSVFGVWFVGGLFPGLRPQLHVTRWMFISTVLGLGVLVGAAFTPQILSQAAAWWQTVLAMMVATFVATSVGMIYMILVRKRDPIVSLLGCVPGGQAEVIMLAEELTDKVYVVALFHLIRVAMVVTITPLVLALVTGMEGLEASASFQAGLPHIWDLPLSTLGIFVGCALIGYPLALMLGLPMAHLFGPMALSAGLHIGGFVEIPRISEFVLLAQVVVGGGVGAKLAKVPIMEILGYVFDGIVNASLVLATYIGMAALMVAIFGLSFMHTLLAFIPGGLYEVTLFALIFGYDVAFVAFHHVVRVLMIFFALPVLAPLLKRTRTP